MTQDELNYLEQATGLNITRSEQGWLWVWKAYQGNVEAIADFISIQSGAIAITRIDI